MTALLLDALAAYRLTRLATADTLLAEPRDAIVKLAYFGAGSTAPIRELADTHGIYLADRGGWSEAAQLDGQAPKLAILVTCRWCAGMWVALGVVAARRLCPRVWPPVAKALAFSAGAALLAGLED